MDHNEAPVSITFKVKSANGFEHLVTLRAGATDEQFQDLMNLIANKEKILLEKQWTPIANVGSSKPSAPAKPCPKHGDPMKQNKNGNWFHTKGAYPNLSYCNGYGFDDERRKDVPERDVRSDIGDLF